MRRGRREKAGSAAVNYSDKINPVVRDMRPSGIRKYFDVVSTMSDVVSLGVGEPDFVTPWGVRNAAIRSLQRGYTQYTSNRGLKELCREIALYYDTRFGVRYDTDEIIVTVGASEAIDLALRTLVRPGDEVLVPDPCYVSYAPCVALAGGTPVAVPCDIEHEFKLMPDALEAACSPRTRVVILAYPNNPTGAIMTREELAAVAEVIIRHDLMVISDEIYAELTYEGTHCAAAAIDGMRERTVTVSGFSKAFAMTGWRLGYVAAPKELTDCMLKIHQYTLLCAPTMAQYAGLAALESGRQEDYATVADMREKYDLRRRYLVSEFRSMGLDTFEPRGAFYVFPSVKSTGMTGETFAEKLLYGEKVAVVPGSAFGPRGEHFIRCSYATAMKSLELAVSRIRRFLGIS